MPELSDYFDDEPLPNPMESREEAFAYLEHTTSVSHLRRMAAIRAKLAKRQNGLCAYCGEFMLKVTLDHVVPRCRGGTDSYANLVAACEPCNVAKGDLDVEEFMAQRRMGLR